MEKEKLCKKLKAAIVDEAKAQEEYGELIRELDNPDLLGKAGLKTLQFSMKIVDDIQKDEAKHEASLKFLMDDLCSGG